MRFLQRVFRRTGGQREEAARNLLYELKQRTQELEAERWFCQRSRLRADQYERTGHWWRDGLLRRHHEEEQHDA